MEITALVRKKTSHLKGLKIAIMGCIVNGPGEAKVADIGLTGGTPNHLIYRDGAPTGKSNSESLLDKLEQQIRDKVIEEKAKADATGSTETARVQLNPVS